MGTQLTKQFKEEANYFRAAEQQIYSGMGRKGHSGAGGETCVNFLFQGSQAAILGSLFSSTSIAAVSS